MRSVVLNNKKADACGICGAKEPFIEYKNLEGIDFIWCNKCNTISFFEELLRNNAHLLYKYAGNGGIQIA